jgi:2-polyprenyl-3-methyl-5-hydroxy-6-metoxy-1,4-benzoquinol methylase
MSDSGRVPSRTPEDAARHSGHSAELTTADYWREFWAETVEIPEFPFVEEIAAHLPRCGQSTFFEVGYAPGGILAQFCLRLECEAHGIDFAADPPRVRHYLESRGVRVGQLHKGDFLTWTPPQQYDIVASFGLVEHFCDPAAIIDRQFCLVRPGGYVIVTMPNYARGQWLLHRLFDPAMLQGHNLRCMNRTFLRRAAMRNGAMLLTARYVGGNFTFCDSRRSTRGWLAERLLWRTIRVLEAAMSLLPLSTNPLFSPYLIAVYRTNATSSTCHEST